MANPATSLPELVERLGKTHSPFERLKILGRAWSLLKAMTPNQRLAVAAQLGLDQADEVVEAIATRGGTKASPVLLSMIDQAQKKGTAHLPQLISDLRDPGKRAERMRQGAAALASAAVTQGEVFPWVPSGPAAPPPLPQAPRPAATAPVAPVPQPRPAAPPPPAPAQAAPVAVAVTAPPPAPPPPAPAPAPASPAVQAAPAPEPKPVEAPAPKPASPPRPAPAPVQTAPRQSLADRLAEVPSLTVRFRVLRHHLAELKKASAASLGPVVQGFPDGWARRRALLELFRAGIPGSLEDSLSLIETLGSERDRLWCLGALTEAREVPEPERDTLLAAVSSPTARRRLAARMER
jgi:hypothetical protein